MADPDGYAAVYRMLMPQFGLVILIWSASAAGAEYRHGSWTALLVREHSQWVLLLGKLLVAYAYSAALAVLGLLAVLFLGLGLCGARGIDARAWFSFSGLWAFVDLSIRATMVGVLMANIGALLAVLARSSAIGIVVGAGWFAIVEPTIGSILSIVVDGRLSWLAALLPQAASSAFSWARGGERLVGPYLRNCLVVVGWGVYAAWISFRVTSRPDSVLRT